jgi:glycosyltransferase involved in cell wall biosynthesis
VKISVIIPAFNEEKLLGLTLEKVKEAMTAISHAGWDSELIVCDNNSSDRTMEIARLNGAAVVFEPINQISRARNCGASSASGDWLVFIDADSHPSIPLFADMLEQIGKGRCLAGGSTIKLDVNDLRGRWVTKAWNWASSHFGLLAGSFIFCKATAFREVGGFNNELFASEELDLTKKLKRLARHAGKKVVILDKYPLLTSGRKLRLYRGREILWFTARTFFTGGRTLKTREACAVWYDGRR